MYLEPEQAAFWTTFTVLLLIIYMFSSPQKDILISLNTLKSQIIIAASLLLSGFVFFQGESHMVIKFLSTITGAFFYITCIQTFESIVKRKSSNK